MSKEKTVEAAAEMYAQCRANCNVMPSVPELMEAFALSQTADLREELERVKEERRKMQDALESISGCYKVEYAISRANETLAECGVPGYAGEV